MKKQNSSHKANHNILIITYIIVLLFLSLIFYFAYFLQIKSEDIINNSYNARLDRFSDRVVRGSILSNDGRVLAETQVDGAGNESRYYPYGSLFSHVAGYSTKGKTGLEALGNFYLLSSHVNLAERVINELSSVKNQGDNLITTLDLDLQKAAFDALENRRGAVIAMDPATGKILAMVSCPDYNPNTLIEDWKALTEEGNTSGQLLNRAAQGLYPPGSTFKIVAMLEYIREHPDDYQNFVFDCDGVFEYGGYAIQCYHKTAHGIQNLDEAFANSCNGAFANLGISMDLGGLKNTAEQLLFNKDLPVQIAYNKSSYEMKQGADTWEILQTSIGQGTTQITPLHNALISAAVANEGILMKPYLIDHVKSAGGDTVKNFRPAAYGSLMTPEEAEILTGLMELVVTEGTGSAVRTEAYTVAGKTGSAEFDKEKESHAWFVGFAPVESPQIVVSVIIEEGGSGGKAAAPVARSVFDAWFSK